MRKRIEVGVWEIFIPGVADGAHYKFELLGPDGRLQPLKADPVGFRHERPPATASRVAGLVAARMARRATGWTRAASSQGLAAPISIYEVHLGSWRRKNGDRVPDL